MAIIGKTSLPIDLRADVEASTSSGEAAGSKPLIQAAKLLPAYIGYRWRDSHEENAANTPVNISRNKARCCQSTALHLMWQSDEVLLVSEGFNRVWIELICRNVGKSLPHWVGSRAWLRDPCCQNLGNGGIFRTYTQFISNTLTNQNSNF